MYNSFNIGEIAEAFGVSAPTLRYWEKEGLLRPNKNKENKYREYDIENLIELLDIILYRNMNMPIKDILKIRENDAIQSGLSLELLLHDMKNKISLLENSIDKIQQRKKHISEYLRLKSEPFQVEDIDIQKIVAFNFSDKRQITNYLECTYNYVKIRTPSISWETGDGLAVDVNDYDENIMWTPSQNKNIFFVTCAIDERVNDQYKSNISDVLDSVSRKYKLTGTVISRFLLCAKIGDYYTDCYKAFIEVY